MKCERMFNSTLLLFKVYATYLIVLFNMISSPELKAKMDKVLEKVVELSALHVASQKSYDIKFRIPIMLSNGPRESAPPEFKFKGHQEQFIHNEEVADHVDLAARKLQKPAPTGDKEKKALEDIVEELQQGMLVILDQKSVFK